jgi:hypothetical protein
MVQYRRGPLSPQFNRADFFAEVKARYEKIWQEEDRLRAARQRQEMERQCRQEVTKCGLPLLRVTGRSQSGVGVVGPMKGEEKTTSMPMSGEEEAYVNGEIRYMMRRYAVVLDLPRLQNEIQNARGAYASILAAKKYTWAGYCGPSCTPNTPLYREGRR